MGLIESKLHKEQIEIQTLVKRLESMSAQQIQTSKQKDQLKQEFDAYKKSVQDVLKSKETVEFYMNKYGNNFFDDEFEREYLTNFLLYIQKSI